jgi:hypothetical protein
MTIVAAIGLSLPPDAGFVIAAYGVILGGMGLYTVTLWRRLRAATSDRGPDHHDGAR